MRNRITSEWVGSLVGTRRNGLKHELRAGVFYFSGEVQLYMERKEERKRNLEFL